MTSEVQKDKSFIVAFEYLFSKISLKTDRFLFKEKA